MRKIIVFSFLQVLLILSIGCKTRYTPVRSQFNNLKVASGEDTVGHLITPQFLDPYRKKLQDSFSTVIATTTGKLVKRRPGGSLGNLVTASILRYYHQYMNLSKEPITGRTKPLFILMNYGGIRLKEIAQGDITIGKIFELLPFENTLVQVEISGVTLSKLLRQIDTQGGWPTLDADFPYEHGTTQEEKKAATLQEIENEQHILLITNNYIAQGGDNCSVLKTLPQNDTQILLRNVVIDYLKSQKTITPDNEDYFVK